MISTYYTENICLNQSNQDSRELSTWKLAHLTKQNGQEKSAVTAKKKKFHLKDRKILYMG